MLTAGCLPPPPAAVRRTLYAGWREVYGCWMPPSPPGESCAAALTLHGYPPPRSAVCYPAPWLATAPQSWWTAPHLAGIALILSAAVIAAAGLLSGRWGPGREFHRALRGDRRTW